MRQSPDPISNGMLYTIAHHAGEAFNDCVMAVGGWLDNIFDGIRGMGKSPLINVEGLGSKINPMNWMRQDTSSSHFTPSVEAKLGRSAVLHQVSIGVPEKPTVALPAQSMSRYQGAFDQFKGMVGGVGIDLNLGQSINGLAPNCAHMGNSISAIGSAFAR